MKFLDLTITTKNGQYTINAYELQNITIKNNFSVESIRKLTRNIL